MNLFRRKHPLTKSSRRVRWFGHVPGIPWTLLYVFVAFLYFGLACGGSDSTSACIGASGPLDWIGAASMLLMPVIPMELASRSQVLGGVAWGVGAWTWVSAMELPVGFFIPGALISVACRVATLMEGEAAQQLPAGSTAG